MFFTVLFISTCAHLFENIIVEYILVINTKKLNRLNPG